MKAQQINKAQGRAEAGAMFAGVITAGIVIVMILLQSCGTVGHSCPAYGSQYNARKVQQEINHIKR